LDGLERKQDPLAGVIARILTGAGCAVLLGSPAMAQTPAGGGASNNPVEEVVITDARRVPYRSILSGLDKLTETVLDTPQSIATLPEELLSDRGADSLNDALRNVPGITLGAGEFSWQGSNPSIRGFSGRDDLYLDGLKDFGSYPRDPFNLESVEVLLGPSSILFGRGSTGGAINQSSKRPMLDPIRRLGVNVGSDDTLRATADIGHAVPRLGDGAAVRLNLLAHRANVADRDGARTERFAAAPTLAFGLGSATRLTLSYLKQVTDDRPDYGLPWLDGRPAPVPRQNFYGFSSDYLETDTDIATIALEHMISESIRIDARFRYASYGRQSRITEPLILQPVPPGTDLSTVDVFRYVFIGDSEETLLTGQVSSTLMLDTGAIRHALVTGLELSQETSDPIFAFGVGAPGTNLLSPDSSVPFTAQTTDPRISADTVGKTLAVYGLDTLDFGDDWKLTLGVRWDRFDTSYDATRFAGPPTPFNDGTQSGTESFGRVDDVLSYRAALVYKPKGFTSLYLAASSSFNPSAQSLSFLTTGRGLGVGNAYLDPEENRSIEAGVKAELSRGRLLLTAAVFQIDKTNARVPDPANPGFNTLGGEQRMRGYSVDATGAVTDRLFLTTGYAHLDGRVVRAAPGAAAGARLANAPEHSFSVWVDYQLADRFDVGLGARYVSEQLAQNTGSGKAVPAYSLFDAMARYRKSDSLTLKINLANLTDEFYFDQLHPWHVVPGAGFTATFAVNVVY
jgi:catecholate siderophore receptor